jgi:hypothetical protein
MQPDALIQAQIDDLLRTDARLLPASPLIGQVFALITEPKPPTMKKPKRARKTPPRVDTGLSVSGGTTTVTFHASDAATLRDAAAALREQAEGDEEDEQAPTSGPPPWLKFCKVKKVPNEYRALFGDKALAVVVVDGWLWARADAETRRAGLVLALRGLEHQERAADGADTCKRTAPPLQTWPDCVDELSHLVAAFTDDPKAAAEDSGAVEAMDGGRLRRVLSHHERLLTAARAEFEETDCCDIMHQIDVLEGQVALLRELIGLDAESGDHDLSEDAEGDLERACAAVVRRRGRPEVDLVVEDDGLQNVEVCWEPDDGEDGWSIYEGGDLHDGFRSLDEVCSSWDMGVYLTRENYKAGRPISIRAVLQALRLEVGLPAEWPAEVEVEDEVEDEEVA